MLRPVSGRSLSEPPDFGLASHKGRPFWHVLSECDAAQGWPGTDDRSRNHVVRGEATMAINAILLHSRRRTSARCTAQTLFTRRFVFLMVGAACPVQPSSAGDITASYQVLGAGLALLSPATVSNLLRATGNPRIGSSLSDASAVSCPRSGFLPRAVAVGGEFALVDNDDAWGPVSRQRAQTLWSMTVQYHESGTRETRRNTHRAIGLTAERVGRAHARAGGSLPQDLQAADRDRANVVGGLVWCRSRRVAEYPGQCQQDQAGAEQQRRQGQAEGRGPFRRI